MKIDRVKLDISIVAGILAVLIVSIFLGFALVGGSLISSDNIKPPINLDYKKFQVDIAGNKSYLSEYNSIVSVAKCGCWCMDTEQGEITIIDELTNLPDVLALCIDQDYLDNYYLTVHVTGGYSPVDCMSYLDLYQKGEYKGRINVVWTNTDPDITTCVEEWTASFVLPDGVDEIILESNQYPDGACHPDDYDTIPGKCVRVHGYSEWEGCHELDQRFWFIQIHQHICK